MSTLQQHTPPKRHRTPARPGAALALIALAALGVALLILTPTGHRTATPTTGSIAQPPAQASVLTAQTPALPSCFRDPTTHALTCYHAASTPTATLPPAGYWRDPVTHKLLRLPTARQRAGQHPANHSRGRIIP
jgi:hypothetical protein